jgi:hypothetical protein
MKKLFLSIFKNNFQYEWSIFMSINDQPVSKTEHLQNAERISASQRNVIITIFKSLRL